MKDKIISQIAGIGLCGLLIIGLFIVKVGFDISWWWVFAPIWLPFAAVAALVIIITITVAVFIGLTIIVISILEYFE